MNYPWLKPGAIENQYIIKLQFVELALNNETKDIFSATSELLKYNEDLKKSSSKITDVLTFFVPKIEELNKKLTQVSSIGNEINNLALFEPVIL